MEHKVDIVAVAAVGRKREIGYSDGRLLWPISADLKRFKELTMGCPVIMGKKTADTLKKPLPGRTNIVLSRDRGYTREGMVVAHSDEEALSAARALNPEKIIVMGGGTIYTLFLPHVTQLELTHVHAEEPRAEVFFPPYEDLFKEVSRGETMHDEKNNVDYHFATWTRK